MARKKKIEYHTYYEGSTRYMSCQICGNYETVGEEAIAVKCSRCVNMLMMRDFPLEDKSYKSTGRPVGWHWMKEFVDKDGKVYHKGKEQPKLKGTLKPTVVKARKKTKRRTRQQILLDHHKEKKSKKKAELKKAIKKQKDFLNHNINK
jgi:ribosomal protein S27E